MNTARRAATRAMEAVYNPLVALFESVFQGLATDELKTRPGETFASHHRLGFLTHWRRGNRRSL